MIGSPRRSAEPQSGPVGAKRAQMEWRPRVWKYIKRLPPARGHKSTNAASVGKGMRAGMRHPSLLSCRGFQPWMCTCTLLSRARAYLGTSLGEARRQNAIRLEAAV